MPYPDNTRHWPIDALVIHKADEKKARMLMRVIAYTKEGRCKTVYADEYAHKLSETRRKTRRVWINDVSELLDPAAFGIAVDANTTGEK